MAVLGRGILYYWANMTGNCRLPGGSIRNSPIPDVAHTRLVVFYFMSCELKLQRLLAHLSFGKGFHNFG